MGTWAVGQGAWWLVALCVLMIGPQQHALFILNHEAAHYRLLPNRFWNDALGSFIGMTGGVSMHTYRVTHRLHHNHLYQPQDPDTAIHGGYPRGKAYLLKKLAQDLIGWNAWKTYAYFFGSPAINAETGAAINPLNDTSPELRAAARRDRWRVVAFQVAAPIALLFVAINDQQMPTFALLSSVFGAYLMFWLLPLLTVLQPILRLRAVLEHGGVTDLSSPLTAARSNRTTGGFINWLARGLLFPHHVNHHLEHHLYPAVPHYHLPALHRLLQAKGALQGAEVRDVSGALDIVFAPRHAKKLKETPHAPAA
jgi:fatty acid desaturase